MHWRCRQGRGSDFGQVLNTLHPVFSSLTPSSEALITSEPIFSLAFVGFKVSLYLLQIDATCSIMGQVGL